MDDPVGLLDFWLGEVGEAGWYRGDAALDALCRERWMDLWQAAEGGGLDHWVEGTVGSLAFVILTDQLPRNMFRGAARAFATDARARAAAGAAIAAGWDLGAPLPERQFFYLPFEHSEDPADQDRAVALMAERVAESPDHLLHARAHAEVIRRFGRFPGRNAALGRVSTAAEEAFLAEGGYGAVVRALEREAGPADGGAL